MKPFWIVAKESMPDIKATVRHETFEAADAEAQRLTRVNKEPFIVLASVGRWVQEQPPLTWDDAGIVDQEWVN